jgi:hypothetical protein
MARLRISLALLVCCVSLSAVHAADPKSTVNKEFDAAVTKLTADVLAYSDADGDGQLQYAEGLKARSQVIEAMVDRMPRASYIAGGEDTVRQMRHRISQMVMDRDADQTIDHVELEKFIGFAIVESEKTLRTPYDIQFRRTMEKSASQVMKYTWATEQERRIKENWKWHAKAVQQQRETWYEIQARKRAMRAEADLEIATARAKADREAKFRETSPGLAPGEDLRPVPKK